MDDVTHVSETTYDVADIAEESEKQGTNADDKLYTVTFKCMGCQHDHRTQNILEAVGNLLDEGQVVPGNIFPENDNPKDSKAVAFKCWFANKWQRIGYVVSEVNNAVRDAMEQNLINDVSFKWAKFISVWPKSGPAFYAGINIAKYGDWPREAYTYASTR